jgi:hypothetical protein
VRSFEYYVDHEKIECIQKEELKKEEMGGGNISPVRKNKLDEPSQIKMKEINGAGDSSQQNDDKNNGVASREHYSSFFCRVRMRASPRGRRRREIRLYR